MIFTKTNALILAAHPDDAEWGLGGVLLRMMDEGIKVTSVAYSPCEESVPKGFVDGAIRGEFVKSWEAIGAEYMIDSYPVRHLPDYRQAILQHMIGLRNTIKPDLVFVPSSGDVHQDHATIHDEAIRAFKHTSMLGYNLPWNHFTDHAQLYVEIGYTGIDDKVDLLDTYQTQQGRPYMSREYIEAVARTRGAKIGVEFAESFEVIRWIC